MISDGCILRLYYGAFLSAKGQGLPSSVPTVFLSTELSCPYKRQNVSGYVAAVCT